MKSISERTPSFNQWFSYSFIKSLMIVQITF